MGGGSGTIGEHEAAEVGASAPEPGEPAEGSLSALEAPRAQAWIAGGIFVLATALRLYFNLVVHPPGAFIDSDMWVYDHRAQNLWRGTLGIWDTFTPPGYPAFLAAVYAVFGRSFVWVGVLQALMGGAIAACSHLLAYRLFASGAVALVASLAVSTHLPLVLYGGFVLTEVPFSLGVVALVALLFRLGDAPSRGRALAAGAALGIATLIRPNLLLLVPALLPWAWIVGERRFGRALALTGWIVAGAMPFLLAASLHNSRIAGKPTGLATNGGLNFYLARAPIRGIEYQEGAHVHRIAPIPNLLRYQETERSERPFWDESHFYRRGLTVIREQPEILWAATANWVEGVGIGKQDYWPGWAGKGKLLSRHSRLFFWLGILPAAIFCVARALRYGRSREGAPYLLLAAIFGTVLATLYLFLGDPRMRVPFDPLILVLAAGAWDRLLHAPRALLHAHRRRDAAAGVQVPRVGL